MAGYFWIEKSAINIGRRLFRDKTNTITAS